MKNFTVLLILVVLIIVDVCCGPSTLSVDDYVRRGDLEFSGSHYDKAVFEYSHALNIDPDNSRVHLKRGESYFLLHRYAESLPDFRAALPSHSSALTYLIKAYHLLGKAEEGDSFLSGCNTASCKRLKTVSDQMKKDLSDARRLCSGSTEEGQQGLVSYANVLHVARESETLRLERAECALRVESLDVVREEISRVLNSNSRSTDALLLLGKMYLKLGGTDAALTTFKKCLRFDPDSSGCKKEFKFLRNFERQLENGERFVKEDNYDSAIEALSEAEKKYGTNHPKSNVMYSLLCHSLRMSKSEADDALRICDLSVELNPSDENCGIDKVELLLFRRDFDKAESVARELVGKFQRSQAIRELVTRAQKAAKLAKRKDYYKILGVPTSATTKEIKRAYRKLAVKVHPDRVPDDKKEEATKMFHDLAEAADVLGDDEKKARYDRGDDPNEQQQPGGGFQGFNPFDFFNTNTGGQGGQGGGQRFTFHFG